MHFRVLEKFWSLGNRFVITDEQERPQYQVRGKGLSWRDQFLISDMEDREVARVVQRLYVSKPGYRLYVNGDMVGELTREHALLRNKFTLSLKDQPLTIEGKFLKYQFLFFRNGEEIAKVGKGRWQWDSHYGVSIAEGEDPLPILGACLAIDKILVMQRAVAV